LALSEADDLAVGRGADAPHRIRVVIADDNPAFCHAWQRVIDADPDMTASRRLAMAPPRWRRSRRGLIDLPHWRV